MNDINRMEFVMRNLLMFGLVLAVASMAGWLKIQRDGERTTIEIDRGEIRSDAKQAIERGREFLDRADRQYAEQQYAEQQYAGQQYAGQQYAGQQYADQQGQPLPYSGQPQYWQNASGASQPSSQQQPTQQWETTYQSGQQGGGGAYQQVQYNDTYQSYPPAGNQASQPAQAAPYVQQQDYRR